MNAARILGDIAADRAGDLRRWVGCVIKAIRRDRFGDREIAHARLHDGCPRIAVDRKNPLEFGERKNDTGRYGQRAA